MSFKSGSKAGRPNFQIATDNFKDRPYIKCHVMTRCWLTVTENMFHIKYSDLRAALHLTVSVALRSVGSARSFVTSLISDSMYL